MERIADLNEDDYESDDDDDYAQEDDLDDYSRPNYGPQGYGGWD